MESANCRCIHPNLQPPATMPSRMMSISDHEFKLLRSLVYERFGINFNEQKRSLVVGKLEKLLRSHGFLSFKQYYSYLQTDHTGQALSALINQLSTNHTFFFRESSHFDFFRTKVLPEIIILMKHDNCRDLRIWCAGCSSGEEPYTLAMVMLEYFGQEYGMWDAGILATDISTRALNKAISGIYPADRINNVPFTLKQRYFIHKGNEEWAITEKVKKEVTFRRFNLMNETFPFKKPFHVIFCRNVMIYFDQPTRDALIQKFYTQTVPGGYLFIGHSESIRMGKVSYEYIKPAVYRKN